MADFSFNYAKGKWAYYGGLPATNDALIAVPLEATGLEADDVLNNYTDLASLLASTNVEQTGGMTRQTLTGVTVTPDNTNNRIELTAANIVFTAATGNATGKLIICYDPDTTGGTDADLIPLLAYDFVATPNGSDITAVVNANGLVRCS